MHANRSRAKIGAATSASRGDPGAAPPTSSPSAPRPRARPPLPRLSPFNSSSPSFPPRPGAEGRRRPPPAVPVLPTHRCARLRGVAWQRAALREPGLAGRQPRRGASFACVRGCLGASISSPRPIRRRNRPPSSSRSLALCPVPGAERGGETREGHA